MPFFHHTTMARVGHDSSVATRQNAALHGRLLRVLVVASLVGYGGGAGATPTQTPIPDESPSTVQYQEGISGTHDEHWRAPIIALQTQKTSKGVKLIIDASVSNEEFQPYPIRFDFFVNRELRSSQIRSVELPGTVGFLVTPEIAVPPFNYSVAATLLHPNRQYVSLAQGAVVPEALTATDLTPNPETTPGLVLVTSTPSEGSTGSGSSQGGATPTPDFEIDPTPSADEDTTSEAATVIIKKILGPIPGETVSVE